MAAFVRRRSVVTSLTAAARRGVSTSCVASKPATIFVEIALAPPALGERRDVRADTGYARARPRVCRSGPPKRRVRPSDVTADAHGTKRAVKANARNDTGRPRGIGHSGVPVGFSPPRTCRRRRLCRKRTSCRFRSRGSPRSGSAHLWMASRVPVMMTSSMPSLFTLEVANADAEAAGGVQAEGRGHGRAVWPL